MKNFVLGVTLAALAVPAAPALADPGHHGGWGHGRPGGGYDRGGYHFRPGDRRLGRGDRVWRGRDGRYYCHRSNGTTGTIVGAIAGGALGNILSNGHNSTLGTLLGAGGGALLGNSIDRGNVRCR